jgi:hypothetical protein
MGFFRAPRGRVPELFVSGILQRTAHTFAGPGGNRIRSIGDGKVMFTYRDRKEPDAGKEMTSMRIEETASSEIIPYFPLQLSPRQLYKIHKNTHSRYL